MPQGKPRVVILGTGWAGARLAHDLDAKNTFNITVISPRNHMVSGNAKPRKPPSW